MNNLESKKLLTEVSEWKVKDILREKGRYEKYPNTKIKKIKKGIFAVSSSDNISMYVDEKGEILFNIGAIGKLSYFKKYCKSLGVEEVKNEKGEYEMFKIEGGKKIKLYKYSIEYFEVWQNIGFLNSRDVILKTFEGNRKNTVYKISDEVLNIFAGEKSIRLIDLAMFLGKGNIRPKQFKKYDKQLQLALLDQIGDERFGLLSNNKEFNLNTKYGKFKINTGKVTKDEVEYLHKAGLISEDIYKLAIEKLDELEKLENNKEEKKKKDLNKLEGNVKGK